MNYNNFRSDARQYKCVQVTSNGIYNNSEILTAIVDKSVEEIEISCNDTEFNVCISGTPISFNVDIADVTSWDDSTGDIDTCKWLIHVYCIELTIVFRRDAK